MNVVALSGRSTVPPGRPPKVKGAKGKDAWIPWVFVLGMLVVIVVNGVLVYFALHSWTGLVTAKPYERGVEYNKVLEAQAQQDALGWTFDADIEPVAKTNATINGGAKGSLLTLRATDKSGAPLDGLTLSGRLVRPIDILPDLHLSFTAQGHGVYTAAVILPKRGQWDLKVRVVKGSDWYHLTRRLFVE